MHPLINTLLGLLMEAVTTQRANITSVWPTARPSETLNTIQVYKSASARRQVESKIDSLLQVVVSPNMA